MSGPLLAGATGRAMLRRSPLAPLRQSKRQFGPRFNNYLHAALTLRGVRSLTEYFGVADQRLSRSTVAAGDATICTSTSDSVTGNEQFCPRQTNAAPSVVA